VISNFKTVLTDAETGIDRESFTIDHEELDLGVPWAWRVVKHRLHGGLQEGVDVVEIHNGALGFAVMPTRGMGILRGWYRDLDLGWESPVKDPVHPTFIDLNDRGGLGWLKGFNEWIVRCGLDHNGTPGRDVVIDNNGNEADVFLPLHGKIANTPARHVSVEITADGTIAVTGDVDETMMFGPALRLSTRITTRIGSNELTIEDRVTNLNRKRAELQLLYHCNYGGPILEEGSRLLAPTRRVAPRDATAVEGIDSYDRFSGPKSGYVEQVYFYNLVSRRGSGETLLLLKNRAGTAGSSLRYRLDELPCFTLWKNTAAREDGYVTGIEPGTNYPNHKRFEREAGRVITLGPKETRTFTLTVGAHQGRSSVRDVEQEIARIQGSRKPRILPQPGHGYSPV
jgi:galactose mutarotase-like enzyme